MDMLVNLLQIDGYCQEEERQQEEGIKIIRALAPDKFRVVDWVRKHSGDSAAGEADVAFSRVPVSCFLAIKGSEILGYACYHATAPDFFGPTKVNETYQGKGIGKALLLRSLNAMKDEGYIYAVIGGVGPVAFYEKCVHAVLIESSKTYSVYKDFLGAIERDEKKE